MKQKDKPNKKSKGTTNEPKEFRIFCQFERAVPGLMSLLCLVFVAIPLAFTLFQGERNPAMYVCFALLLLPFLFCGVWTQFYRIDVYLDEIHVRRGIGTRYSFTLSEIIRVEHRIHHTNAGTNEKITLFTAHHKASVETLMIQGFEQMKTYVYEHVPSDKIEIKERNYL